MIELKGKHKYKGFWSIERLDGVTKLTRYADGLQMFVFGNMIEALGKLEQS